MRGAGFKSPKERQQFDRARTPITAAEIAQLNMPRCFRCPGIGHVASACAKPADTVITTATAIETLIRSPFVPPPLVPRVAPPPIPAAVPPFPLPPLPPPSAARVNFVDEDDVGYAPEGEAEEAFLARLEEFQILGEEDPYDDPLGDSAACIMSKQVIRSASDWLSLA
jgi:hypothetical protein